MKKTIFITTLWMLIQMPFLVSAQCGDAYMRDVKNQILNSSNVQRLLRNGYELTHEVKILGLKQNIWDNFTLNLQSGYTYEITSRCDRDCMDLDLKIFDGNGNLIDEDVESDDYPQLSVTPRWSGKFTLYVRAYKCSNPPCCTGIIVLGK